MAATEPPVGLISLSKLVAWNKLELRTIWVMGIMGTLLLTLCIITTDDIARLLLLISAILLIGLTLWRFLRELEPLRIIAVNLGHPWIVEEHDIDEATVALRTSNSEWNVLPPESGMVRLRDGTNELVFIEDETDGQLMSFNSRAIAESTLQWLNNALALRDAQNSIEGASFESARIREQQESTLMERKWEDTAAGQFEVRPGVLLRGRSRSINDDGEI